MTRLDQDADAELDGEGTHSSSTTKPGPAALILEARDVPLGGLRSMTVSRTLPQRAIPTIGAWCFVDRFGPQQTTMRVDPHPHIGLQTVTWPLTGEVRHRDNLGSDVTLTRGSLNLMTAGHGVAHSEYSVRENELLDALQLWVALPQSDRDGAPAFERHDNLPHVDLATDSGAARATVFMGSFAGATSPATAFSPIAGVEITLDPGTSALVPLEAAWEYGLLTVSGVVDVHEASGDVLASPRDGALAYLPPGRDHVRVDTSDEATVVLLGGEPFGEDIVMWWNFVGRSHEDIERAREDWEAHAGRFGVVPGHGDTRIPAPPLPPVRIKPRQRRPLT